MFKKLVFFISIFLLGLICYQVQKVNSKSITNEAKEAIINISKIYKEEHPKILVLDESDDDDLGEKVYRIEIRGDFYNERLSAKYITLSVSESGKQFCVIAAYDDKWTVIWNDKNGNITKKD
jgi:hypothetical protein